MNNPNIIQSDIKRFNWGAFFLTWIWGIGNNVMETLWILVTGFVPVVGCLLGGLVLPIIFGIKGNEWALKNKSYKSLEHFHSVQRTWAIIGLSVYIATTLIWIVIGLSLFENLIKPEIDNFMKQNNLTYSALLEEFRSSGKLQINIKENGDVFINDKKYRKKEAI